MNYNAIIDRVQQHGSISVCQNAPMRDYTSFRIGGTADLLLEPQTKEALLFCCRAACEADLPLYVFGAGSNVLVGDRGIRGVVVRLAAPFNAVSQNGCELTAEAGISLARLAAFALSAELTGLEFAGGIPGTLGGALFMNAGAYGGEMKDVVIETEYLDLKNGSVNTISGDAHKFGYRHSIFSDMDCVILTSRLRLAPGSAETIRSTMHDLNERRREKQPLTFPSAGSTFKRPEGYFAAKLIEDTGLKGRSCGGAQVSTKHAGFIVNTGNATAADVRRLIEQVQKTVMNTFGVALEPEVRFVGEFETSL